MKTKHVYICEDSTAGIFTGIYDAWASNYGHAYNQILVKEPYNMEFFSENVMVNTDPEKAYRVTKAIRNKISLEAYIMIYNCTLSKREDKADHIYRFLILGFAMGKEVLRYLTNEHVDALAKMDMNVKMEFFHYEGFLRFLKMENEILFARFRPENNIISVIADFFADRLPDENWLICDENRKIAAVHETGKVWFLYQDFVLPESTFPDLEDEYYKLWEHFVHAIGIKERTNGKLQLQMLPNRFREFMPEVEYKDKKRRQP